MLIIARQINVLLPARIVNNNTRENLFMAGSYKHEHYFLAFISKHKLYFFPQLKIVL